MHLKKEKLKMPPFPLTQKTTTIPFASLQSQESIPSLFQKPSYEFPENVPQEYRSYVEEASNHIGIPTDTLVKLINTENAQWNPKQKGVVSPDDYGITQMSSSAVKSITGSRGRNYFKDNYGEEFDKENPRHQILAMGVHLNAMKQFDFPKFGINNPTLEDLLLSYNLGVEGYIKAIRGKDKKKMQILENYRATLKKNGVLP